MEVSYKKHDNSICHAFFIVMKEINLSFKKQRNIFIMNNQETFFVQSSFYMHEVSICILRITKKLLNLQEAK